MSHKLSNYDIEEIKANMMYNEYKEGYDKGWKDGYDYRIEEGH